MKEQQNQMQSNVVVNAIHKNCLGTDNMQAYVSTLILFVLKISKQTKNSKPYTSFSTFSYGLQDQ